MLRTISDVSLLVALLAVLAFLAVQTTAPHWHRSVMGRHLVTTFAVFAGVMINGAVRAWFGDYPGYLVIRTVLFVALATVLVRWLWLSLRARRLVRRIRAGRLL